MYEIATRHASEIQQDISRNQTVEISSWCLALDVIQFCMSRLTLMLASGGVEASVWSWSESVERPCQA